MPDPLAGYTPDWRERLAGSDRPSSVDPLAGYTPDWRRSMGIEEPPDPGPGLLSTIKSDFGHLAKLFRGTVPADQFAYDPSLANFRPEKPTAEDLIGGGRAVATMAFPLGMAAETAVGGAVGALSGEPNAAAHAYQEGAFGPIKRATGLDRGIEKLAVNHPYLAAGVDVAGTIAAGAGAEAGVRKAGRAVASHLKKATDIGESVADAFRSLTPEDMPGNPGAVDPSLRPATMPDRYHRSGEAELDAMFGPRRDDDYLADVGGTPERVDQTAKLPRTPEAEGVTFTPPAMRHNLFNRELDKLRGLDDADLIEAYKTHLRTATRTGADEMGRAGSYFRANARSADARVDAAGQVLDARGIGRPTMAEAWQDIPAGEAAQRRTTGETLERAAQMSDDELRSELAASERAAQSAPGDRHVLEKLFTLAGHATKRGLLLGDEYGAASRPLVSALARAGAGAAVGGSLDAAEGDDSPIEGALAGAAAGAALRPELWDRVVGVKNSAATKLWEKNEKLGSFFFTGHPLPEAYKGAREAMDRSLNEAKMVAEEVHQRVRDYPAAVQKLLSDLADEGAAPEEIERRMALAGHAGGPDAAKVVQDVHSMFSGLGERLFRLGQLSRESLDKFGGRYLPRYYRAAEEGGEGALESGFVQPRQGKVRLDPDALGRLKRRADEVSPETEARRIEHFGYRAVTGALQEGELAAKEGFFQSVKGMDDVVHPAYRDAADKLRELEAMKRAARKAEAEGVEGAGKDARAEKQRLNDEIDGLREQIATASQEAKAKGFVQLPTDKRLGSMSGMYVRKDVAHDLQGLARPAHLYGSLVDGYDKWLRRWKKGKTVLNPATHGRNIVGAQFLSWLGDGPVPFGPTYWKAVGMLRHEDALRGGSGKAAELYREARRGGVLDSSFAREQIETMGKNAAGEDAKLIGRMRAGSDAIASPEAVEAGSLGAEAGKVMEAGKGKLAKIDQRLTDIYHKEDVAARLAHFIHQREVGASVEEAGRSAKKWVPTFHNLADATRAWSRVVPFFSYTAAALPLVAEASVKNPVRFLAAGALSYALGKQVFDEDVPEQVLPREMRGPLGAPREGQPIRNTVKRMAAGAVPTFIPVGEDADHRRTYLDFTYIMPWGDIAENRGGGHGPLDAIPQQFNPISNPLVGTLASLALNRDRLTGRDLTRPSMTGGEKLGVASDYVYKQALPSLAPAIPGTPVRGGWGFQKLHDAFTATPNWYGEVRSPGSALLDALGGMKQRQVLPTREYSSRFREVRREMEDLRSRMAETLRDPRISDQDKEAFRQRALDQMERLRGEASELSSLRDRVPGAQ